MKKCVFLFLMVLSSIVNGQDSGMFNAGNFGGPVTYGIPSGSDIYFSQGNKLNKGIEGAENIEITSNSYLLAQVAQIIIDGDNMFLSYVQDSDYKNNVAYTTLSNLSSSSSSSISGISSISKFAEIDKYILAANNKDGVLSDKLIGTDLFGSSNDSFEYVVDFIDFAINGYTAYLITDDGTTDKIIEIIDFSAKSSANKVGSIQVKNAKSLYYSNGYLYVGCVNGDGLKIIDVSNSTAPVLAGKYDANSFTQVIVDGTTAYLRNENVLTILNVSDPTNPTFVSTKTFNSISASVKFTAVENEKIYYVDNGIFGIIEAGTLSLGQKYLSPLSSDWVAADETTLVVYDKASYYFHSLEDPYNPKAYAVLAADFVPVDFDINGTNFYVTTNNKFSIYDIENLATPSADFNYYGEFSTFKIANDFAVIGEYKYSGSTKYYYFELIDLSDKSNPTQLHLEEYATIGTITSIELSPDNNTLYLSSELNNKIWLTIFDITNKSAPTKVYAEKLETITSNTIDGKETRLGINGSELYLVTNYVTLNGYNAAKIFAYSVQESSNPRLIAGLQITESEYSNVVFFDENILVAVPSDKEIHMYSLEGDSTFRKEWNQIETLLLENEHANMASYLNKTTQSTLAPKGSKLNKINGDEWDYTTVVISEKPKGTKLIEVYVPKKVVTKVTLTTSVLPAEASSGGCTVSPSGGEYDKNSSVSISASAASGWLFNLWSGDLTGSASPSSLTMDNDKNVIGNFQPKLTLGFASTLQNNYYPPKSDEKIYLGTTNLTAGGVDWQLLGLTYTAVDTTKSEYTSAYIKYNGIELKGTITSDANGNISAINFPLTYVIPEGQTFSCMFYYKFNFPSTFDSLYIPAPIGEVKNLRISINRNKVSAMPLPESARPGIKLPEDTFTSNKQTIASIWNISHSPALPYNTIQEAIDDPLTIEGNLIKVEAGNYQMNTKVTKSVTIFAPDGSDSTIISGLEDNKDVFRIVESNVKISGFKIRDPIHKGYFPNPIHILGETKKIINCEIINNQLVDDAEILIIENADSCKIINNAIYDYGFGITLVNSNGNLIKNNQIGVYNDVPQSARNIGIIFNENCMDNRIEENQISGNQDAAISFRGNNIINNKIINNKIGTNSLGGEAIPNIQGIVFRGQSTDIIQYNLIENNLISGNMRKSVYETNGRAIRLSGANTKHNIIRSNLIGTTANGYAALHNTFGIDLDYGASENLIEDNTIIAEEPMSFSIRIGHANVANTGNKIKNNKLGTNIVGDEKLTSGNGILIFNNSSNIEITDNLISGNVIGIGISGYRSKNFLIANNKVGTNLAGTSVIPNIGGIVISEGVKNARVENNLISGNIIAVEIAGSGTSDNFVMDNKIGTDINGVTKLGNDKGILIYEGAQKTRVERNLISGNIYPVIIQGEGTNENIINRNIIGLDINEEKILTTASIGIIIQENATNNYISNNVVGGFSQIGITMFSGANHNKIIRNFVGTNSTLTKAFANKWGINIGEANYNQIAANWVWNNIHGIGDIGKYNIIANNNLKNNTGNTGIHLNGALNTKVIGNVITEDGSNAIVTENGANPTIVNNNIHNNSGFGLENRDPSVSVSANGNWWGNVSGPGENISGNIIADTWLSGLKGLTIVPETDTIFIPIGGSDSLILFIENWKNQNDLTNISLNSEKNNWLVSENHYSLQLSDTSAGLSEVMFEIPTSATVNDFSKVNVFATSSNNEDLDTSSFYVVTYMQNLTSIIVSPDSVNLEVGDSLQFNAFGYDTHGAKLNVEVKWSSSGGSIDSTGFFHADEVDSTALIEIFAENIQTGIVGKAIAIVGDTVLVDVEDEIEIPTKYLLNQNYPNPFNPSTTISYALPYDSKVRVEIFNVLGQRVDVITNGVESAGLHSTLWNAGHLASGIYIIRINATSVSSVVSFTKSIKMILMK